MMLKLSHPQTWDFEVDNEIHMSDVNKKIDNIKGKVNADNIDTDIYNCLEFVEAVLEGRVPMYRDLY